MFYFLESLSKLEQRHEVVTNISVERFRSVLQTKKKADSKIDGSDRTENEIQAESEAYHRLSGVQYEVG